MSVIFSMNILFKLFIYFFDSAVNLSPKLNRCSISLSIANFKRVLVWIWTQHLLIGGVVLWFGSQPLSIGGVVLLNRSIGGVVLWTQPQWIGALTLNLINRCSTSRNLTATQHPYLRSFFKALWLAASWLRSGIFFSYPHI